MKYTISILMILNIYLLSSVAYLFARDVDVTPPQIISISITPTRINTESSDQTLTLSVTLSDDQSGVCLYSDDCLYRYEDTPTQFSLTLITRDPQDESQTVEFNYPTRTSGDEYNGTYTAIVTIPKGSATGIWGIGGSRLIDQSGNFDWISYEDIEVQFGAGYAEVVNAPTGVDVSPPRVKACSITPTRINTESSDQTLTLSVTLTDDQSGVCVHGDCGSLSSYTPTFARLAPASGTQYVDFYELTRTSGDKLNGTYTATATIPKGSATGTWEINTLYMSDQLRNNITKTKEYLESQYGTGCTEIVNIGNYMSRGLPWQMLLLNNY